MSKFEFSVKSNGFDRGLLERSKPLDLMYSQLGSFAPRKRLLHVDYKEKART